MFDILICAYGDHFGISKRCIDSVLNLTAQPVNIHIGLNKCGSDTKNYCRQLLDNQKISTIIDSNINMNKDPMMRKLIDCVQNEYFLWLDDDSYVNEKFWDLKVREFIKDNFDVAGFPHVSNRLAWPYNNPPYYEYLKNRPWFNGIIKKDENNCVFPVGGCWLAKTEYLRKHNFPDRGMHLRWHQHRDDMLMGDMIKETEAKWKTLFGWQSIFMVNQAERRGEK
jgi:hypothetical protein